MSSSVFRIGDLVTFRTPVDDDNLVSPGIIIKVRRREIASPHPNYRGRHPPIELKVEEIAEVMWSAGVIDTHNTTDLKRVKKKVKSQ